MTDEDDIFGDLREDAERLVSAGMAAASYALRGIGRVTPLGDLGDLADRAIGVARSPAPRLAWKLAGGLTGVASGVTSVLRAAERRLTGPVPDERFTAPPRQRARDAGATWRVATRGSGHAGARRAPAAGDDPWRAATADPPGGPDPAAENLLPPDTRA